MAKAKSCPSLGLENDQNNHMSIATIYHYCYHQAKPRTINLSHQNELCLNENYKNCPIFLSDKRTILENRFQTSKIFGTPNLFRYGTNASQRRLVTIISFIALLVFTILLVLIIKNQYSLTNLTSQTNPKLTPGNFTNRATSDFLLTPNPTLNNSYSFLELTLQALDKSLLQGTPTLFPLEKTSLISPRTLIGNQNPTEVVCVIPDGWIVYQVKSWDTLLWLSKWVRTPVDKLMEANCMTTQTLVVGQDIFLPYYPKIDTHTPTPLPTNDNGVPVSTSTSILTATRTPTITTTPSPTKNPLFVDTPTPTRTLSITLTPSSTNTLPPTPSNTSLPTETPTDTETPTLNP